MAKASDTKKTIANAFNTYVSSIGKAMADSLPEVEGFEDHLGLISKHKMRLRPLEKEEVEEIMNCLLYTSPSPRDKRQSRMPSFA